MTQTLRSHDLVVTDPPEGPVWSGSYVATPASTRNCKRSAASVAFVARRAIARSICQLWRASDTIARTDRSNRSVSSVNSLVQLSPVRGPETPGSTVWSGCAGNHSSYYAKASTWAAALDRASGSTVVGTASGTGPCERPARSLAMIGGRDSGARPVVRHCPLPPASRTAPRPQIIAG
jgi:hypothetical protein